MSKDLFAAPINGHAFLKRDYWIVGVFSGNGAVQVIKRANERDIKTFYPIRRTFEGEYTPLWKSYLFIEFVESVTIDLCRTTGNFLRIISERDEDGLVRPVLVRKNGINESLELMTQGKFDDIQFKRQFRGRGSIIRVIEGTFIDMKVRLDEDVFPDMHGNHKVKVDLNGLKATVELFKLAL
jgi:transcription antitermination factor NusG